MDYLKSKKEILALKIRVFQTKIKNLQMALDTYRVIKSIQVNNHEYTVMERERERDTDMKIAEIINSINRSIEMLSTLEKELAEMEGDNMNHSN